MKMLLLKGTSKEDMKLMADLAIRMGITAAYVNAEDLQSAANEPGSPAESGNHEKGLPDTETEDVNDDVIRKYRERFD